ncbi:hypothetical protein CPB85DRAFT_829042 [Mucidula mucida]|nr:hypothetical protein CPB85DRAFT_829042 [Mucidula mucida]
MFLFPLSKISQFILQPIGESRSSCCLNSSGALADTVVDALRDMDQLQAIEANLVPPVRQGLFEQLSADTLLPESMSLELMQAEDHRPNREPLFALSSCGDGCLSLFSSAFVMEGNRRKVLEGMRGLRQKMDRSFQLLRATRGGGILKQRKHLKEPRLLHVCPSCGPWPMAHGC